MVHQSNPSSAARGLVACLVWVAGVSAVPPDWLVTEVTAPVTLTTNADGSLSLSNSLLTRTFAVQPGFGTVDFVAEASATRENRESMLRSVVAEALVVLDGTEYKVGGLSVSSQNHSAYLRRPASVVADSRAFTYVSHSTRAPEAAVPWEPGSRHAPNVSWPPRGLRLDVSFAAPKNVSRVAHGRVRLTMHYELYEGSPQRPKTRLGSLPPEKKSPKFDPFVGCRSWPSR